MLSELPEEAWNRVRDVTSEIAEDDWEGGCSLSSIKLLLGSFRLKFRLSRLRLSSSKKTLNLLSSPLEQRLLMKSRSPSERLSVTA